MPNEEKKEPMTPEIVNPHDKATQERIAAVVPAGSADVGKKNEPDIDLGFGTSELRKLNQKHLGTEPQSVSVAWLGEQNEINKLPPNTREVVETFRSDVTKPNTPAPTTETFKNLAHLLEKSRNEDEQTNLSKDEKEGIEDTLKRAYGQVVKTARIDPNLTEEQKEQTRAEYKAKMKAINEPKPTSKPAAPPESTPAPKQPEASKSPRGPIIPPHAPTQPNKVTMKVQMAGGKATPPKPPSRGQPPVKPPDVITPPPPEPEDEGGRKPLNWMNYTPEQLKEIGQAWPSSTKKGSSPQQNITKNDISEAIQEGLLKARENIRITESEQYQQFLTDERYCSQLYEISRKPDEQPDFYRSMKPEERRIFDVRLELQRGTWYVRNTGKDPAEFSKNIYLEGLTKEETKELFNIPGVYTGFARYIEMMDTNHKINGVTLLGCRHRQHVESFRHSVQDTIRQELFNIYNDPNKWNDPNQIPLPNHFLSRDEFLVLSEADRDNYLNLKSQDAEQIAFNLHKAGMTFEDLSVVWETDSVTGRKVRITDTVTRNDDLVNVGVLFAMKPLNTLIFQTLKPPSERVDYGRAIGKWAGAQIAKSIEGQNIGGYGQIVVLKPEEVNENNIWKTEHYEEKGEDKVRIYVFEACPNNFFGSIWQETTLGKYPNGEKRPLIDYFRKGEPIPWDTEAEAHGLWSFYLFKAGQKISALDYFKGKKPISWGSEGRPAQEWMTDANNALSTLGIRDNNHFRRVVLYNAIGIVKNDEKLPKIAAEDEYKKQIKLILGSPPGFDYLPDKELFFPWDQIGSTKGGMRNTRIGRWFRGI